MKFIFFGSILAFLTTGLGQLSFGRGLFKEDITPVQRLKKLFGIIISGVISLGYLTFYLVLAKQPGHSVLRENLKWIFFWGIILVSLIPTIIIYENRSKQYIFDTIKPVVNVLTIISTIFLFLMRTFGVVKHELYDYSLNSILNNIGYIVVQYSPFLIYPHAIAFTLGQYFVKEEQLILKQAKQLKLNKKITS